MSARAGLGARAMLVFAVVLGPGCYLSHQVGGGPPVEIGSGVGGFEPIPAEGAVLEVVPHPRGGWGVALSIRVRELDPTDAAVTCTVTDIATGDLLAAPRFDEPHRWIPEGTHWVSSGTYALFVWDLEPEELEGVMVRVEANLVTRGDEAFSDARLVRLTAGD